MSTPENDDDLGFSQSLGNLTLPSLTRLNRVNVLKDEGLVNAQEFNYGGNERNIDMAVGDKDVCALSGHRDSFKTRGNRPLIRVFQAGHS